MAVLTGEGAGLVLSARTGLCHQPPRSTCIPGLRHSCGPTQTPDPRPGRAEGSCSVEGPAGEKGLEG